MEVTTVSPSPASPTEGDDLCETDVPSMAIHSVTLLICLCGLVGNGAVIGLLTMKSGNYRIFNLAVADFLFLLFTVPSALLFLVEDASCSSIVPLLYQNFFFQLTVVSYYWALFQLIPMSNVQYIYMSCKLCCHWDLPKRLWLLVISVQYWAFFALFTVILTLTFLCPSQEQKHCWAALISMYTFVLLFFAAPLLISTTSDFIKAKCGSQQQQPKRRDIVIHLTALLTVILSFCHFLQQLGYIVVPSQFFFLLASINSSIKPFIYFLVGSWRTDNSMQNSWKSCSMASCCKHCTVGALRDSLQRVFEKQKEKTDHRDDDTRDTVI
ncbi:mas-related G-protein coupled receptor member H-like [Ammospiza nelsoni]|uniref:mas-related G-protein coupled receptor member H-like n=1 Tax=Ammospiza caudacuta TaxID=2857398 RepID=UPI00273878BC|nr:mas-related G-protein coupled receptor member H-like [Ammospiza caudacuta]XP_059331381.1 mas-related G-protein coupled receptor member H-like [Ammospiza nelsoni]